jgi:FKBP-type peptidyl-prolyl cis-trans isomerase
VFLHVYLHVFLIHSDSIRKRLEEEGRLMLKQMEETEGVLKLDNGVYVHVLEPNENGQRPTRSSTVRVHYHGSLPDGTVFDSTADSEPVTFPLAQVIPGWRDGLLKMREGETAMVGIPPEQAYGEEGTPDGRIPGGSTLFFKIQLLEVLSAGVGGTPSLLGADGKKLDKDKATRTSGSDTGLVGADGKPL